MERIVIDIFGELFEIDNGNRYILVVVDYFIYWMECFVMFNMKLKIVVMKIVEEVIIWFGVLDIIYLD